MKEKEKEIYKLSVDSNPLDILINPHTHPSISCADDGTCFFWPEGNTSHILDDAFTFENEANIVLADRILAKAETLPCLRFKHPDFEVMHNHPIAAGLPITTVRLGHKWYQARNSMVMVCDDKGEFICPADVTGRRLTTLLDITCGELALHHSGTESLYGITSLLKDAYGKSFSGTELMTVLTFQPVVWGMLL